MSKDTRINVHLHELKELMEEFLVEEHGDISRLVRELIGGLLRGEVMFIDPKVHELLDEGRDKEAVELLTAELGPLREKRLRIGAAVAKKRSQANAEKGQSRAGVKSAARQQADALVQQYLANMAKGGEASGGKT